MRVDVVSKTHGIEHTVKLKVRRRGKSRAMTDRVVKVTASTPALAACFAVREAKLAGVIPVKGTIVTERTFDMKEICGRCEAIVLDGEFIRLRDGVARCYDCA